jgi:hypothetical protein
MFGFQPFRKERGKRGEHGFGCTARLGGYMEMNTDLMTEEQRFRFSVVASFARIEAKIELLMQELESGVLTPNQRKKIATNSKKDFEKHLASCAGMIASLGEEKKGNTAR